MVRNFLKLLAYCIVGLIFGFSFFLIFLNFYHYEEVNRVYEKQSTDEYIYKGMIEKLNSIKEISTRVTVDNYRGNEEVLSISRFQTKLNTCVDKIDTPEFSNLLKKKKISIKDVYDLQQFYQSEIADECMVKQLYDVVAGDDTINISGFRDMSPFFENEINHYIKATDYVQKNIKGNSSYYFVSANSRNTIYDQVKDSYYLILNEYQNSIDFIYDIAMWYGSKSEG